MKPILQIFILIQFILPPSFAQEPDKMIETHIDVQQDENIINFIPTIQNHSALFFEYNYLLLVKKTDAASNISVNKQSGKFTLEPREIKELSSSKINQSPNQSVKAILYIRDENENKLISKDSVEIKGNFTTKVEETSLFIEGLVVDESKTKFGKEFYDQFYSVYNQYPKKHRFIILISEMPYRGQTSIIQVKVDQETLYEFYTNPNEEYAKHQVNMALRSIEKYAENLQKIKKEFNY